jgi:hypothetical protein
MLSAPVTYMHHPVSTNSWSPLLTPASSYTIQPSSELLSVAYVLTLAQDPAHSPCTCSSSHAHNFSAFSLLSVSFRAFPTRAHGIKYWCKLDQNVFCEEMINTHGAIVFQRLGYRARPELRERTHRQGVEYWDLWGGGQVKYWRTCTATCW